jgi:hypothetical protein
MKSELTALLLRFKSNAEDLKIFATMGDSESLDFANAIADCRPKGDKRGVCQVIWRGNPKGIAVSVKNPQNAPPLALALVRLLSGRDILPSANPEITDDNKVQIDIFPIRKVPK